MSTRKYMGSVKKRVLRGMLKDFPEDQDGAVTEYAQEAYDCCVTWFGQPLDPRNSYLVQQAVDGGSYCSRRLGTYCLVISTEATAPEQICLHVAHEMYHRVTTRQKGLASDMWVQEMMASLSSHWFLRRRGFSEYAEAVKEDLLGRPGGADVAMLRTSRRRAFWDLIFRGGDPYSPEFVTSVGRVAYALNRLLDADDLRRIIKATTLEEWIASLPSERQYAVCRVLDIATHDKAIPSDEKGLDRLFDALEAKGNINTPVAEFKQIVQLQPENGVAFFYLGYAHDGAGEHNAALDAYAQAKKFGYEDKWLFYNIGVVHWQMENYLLAEEWFRRAVEQDPDWAQALYLLGCSLNKLGNIVAAHQSWEKVLTLDDEHYAKLAQSELAGNPLPPEVAQS